MSECAFLHELRASLVNSGWFVVRIPDDAKNQADYDDLKLRAKKKGFDTFAGKAGRPTLCIEAKQVRRGMNFPLSNIKDHQWTGLELAEGCGWDAGVAVNFRVRITLAQRNKFGLEDFVVNRSFYFPHWWLKWAKDKRAITSLNLEQHYFKNQILQKFEIPSDGDLWDAYWLQRHLNKCVPEKVAKYSI